LGDANESHYSAAKAAIQAFTKSLAKESAPKGIRVNAIAPGLIYNEFLARIYPKESLDNIIEQTPVGRVGKPADIANTVLFLVSNKGSFVTGETFCISGGLYMR
jgi:3-oxoacyl-[acyl-carrier protein] reductase